MVSGSRLVLLHCNLVNLRILCTVTFWNYLPPGQLAILRKKNWKTYVGNWLYKKNILFTSVLTSDLAKYIALQNKYDPKIWIIYICHILDNLNVSYFVRPAAYLWHILFWKLTFSFIHCGLFNYWFKLSHLSSKNLLSNFVFLEKLFFNMINNFYQPWS